jgi:hypothetical protein
MIVYFISLGFQVVLDRRFLNVEKNISELGFLEANIDVKVRTKIY